MEIPRTYYARSGEIAIAYQVHGDGEHDLLFSGSTASNVETVWTLPSAVRLFERLGRFARVIRFDRRDSGVSDPVTDDLTLEAHTADALAVMDAVGAERPILMGALDGARSLAALAATQPARAGGLVALAATAQGLAVTSPDFAATLSRDLASLDWPGSTGDIWAPEWAGDPVLADLLHRYIQTSVSPLQSRRLIRLSMTSDVTDVLPLVQTPTLVLRARDSLTPPADAVRDFADRIPGATYRELPGSAVLLFALDPDMLADVIEEFVTGTAPSPVTNRSLATVLFTDLVGSTRQAAQLGDRAWADLLERHHDAVRVAVGAHGGETVKTLGDGVLALFAGPAQGVRCAQLVSDEAGRLGLEVRAGLHTGEVERSGTDVAGLAVHLAARIMGLAGAGEVFASRTVKDLVIGSDLRFEDRGEHELKGVPERWAVYAATR